MVSSKERLKLIHQYRHEPVCVYGTLLRAAAGLLFIAISAVIGVTSRSDRDADLPQAEVQRHDRAAGFREHEALRGASCPLRSPAIRTRDLRSDVRCSGRGITRYPARHGPPDRSRVFRRVNTE